MMHRSHARGQKRVKLQVAAIDHPMEPVNVAATTRCFRGSATLDTLALTCLATPRVFKSTRARGMALQGEVSTLHKGYAGVKLSS
jgi:hypothetical protein